MGAIVETVERYLRAVAEQDWDAFTQCVTDDVCRVGPYGDTYRGKDEYVAYLRELMPTLAGYRMEVHRVHLAGDTGAVAELTETVTFGDRVVRTPEAVVFECAPDGMIRHVTIYIQQLSS